MKAAELFVQCLENEEVDYIFGIPGEENLDLMDALLGDNLSPPPRTRRCFYGRCLWCLTGKPGFAFHSRTGSDQFSYRRSRRQYG
ncbi:hypothetical protein THIOSC15_570003 [uncultured Thiomicrorhabdus sp.]